MPDQMQLFPLTDDEWRHRSKQLAALMCEYTRVEENKRETVKAFGDTLKALRQQMDKLADAVVQGREWRERPLVSTDQDAHDLVAEEALGADGVLDDENISVTCRHCRAEFPTFATYITHRREAHPVV